MDTAVAMVQAYLQVNGYFTVAEYPIIETFPHRPAQMLTDLDLLGFRFPGAGAAVAGSLNPPRGKAEFRPDPALNCPPQTADMIVGEVKEGRATFNRAAHDPDVLTLALARFGCCEPHHIPRVVEELLHKGQARTHCGHLVRLVAFGTAAEEPHRPWGHVVPLSHVTAFLERYLDRHWETVKCMQLKEPILGLFTLLRKVKARESQSQEQTQ